MVGAWRSGASTASTARSPSAWPARAWRAFAGSPTSSGGRSPFTWRASGQADEGARRGTELWQAGRGKQAFPDSGEHRHADRPRGAGAARRRRGARAGPICAGIRTSLAPQASSAISRSAALLRDSVRAYRRDAGGRRRSWRRRALDGFELAEASLDAVDRGLRGEVETQMMRYRGLAAGERAAARGLGAGGGDRKPPRPGARPPRLDAPVRERHLPLRLRHPAARGPRGAARRRRHLRAARARGPPRCAAYLHGGWIVGAPRWAADVARGARTSSR